jgi:hypothetical protein
VSLRISAHLCSLLLTVIRVGGVNVNVNANVNVSVKSLDSDAPAMVDTLVLFLDLAPSDGGFR